MNKILTFVIGLCMLPAAAIAEEARWWQFWRSDRQAEQPVAGAEPVREAPNRLFSEEERQRIRDYLRGRHTAEAGQDEDHERGDRKGKDKDKDKNKKQKPVPPGLQKKVQRGGELPPGWQMKVQRGEVIDADMYGQSEALPPEFLRRLRNPEGTETRVLGDRVFRVMEKTRQVVDVIQQD